LPGAGTHATIIHHLAEKNPAFKAALGDPTLNTDWTNYRSDEALRSRYAVLGAMGPDIFYAMLDYGGDIQKFEDVLIKVAGTFECVGELSGEINNIIDSTLNSLTLNVWDSIQATFKLLIGILKDGILDELVDKHNFFSFFLPLRQVDDFRQNWYWADFLHYVKTGCFTQKLLDTCQTYSNDPRTTAFLKAYSLGYVTHYVADTVGHAYVNRIVETPWRNCWQRHHLVENFIDAYVSSLPTNSRSM
jgi:Zinc dependent phospholipase C